jgi:hypothetical protein
MERELMASKMHTVTKSQQAYTCTKCGDEIPAGSQYRYFKPGFRGRAKVRRCMKPECTPRRSELDNSQMADVFAAQEDAETDLNALEWDDAIEYGDRVTEIEEILKNVAESAQEVADQYEESIQNMPALENGDVGERLNALTDWISALEAWCPVGVDFPEPENGSTEERREWLAACQELFDNDLEDAKAVLGDLPY